MSVGPTPVIIYLPCYHGFNQFAVWSVPQSVSKMVNDYLKYFFLLKSKSLKLFCCNSNIVIFSASKLLWPDVTESILSPLPSGEWIGVYFYPGCRYAAFPARSSEDVRMFILII